MGSPGPDAPLKRGQDIRLEHQLRPFDPLLAALDDYLLALEAEGRSPRTIQVYGDVLRPLAGSNATPAGHQDVSACKQLPIKHWTADLVAPLVALVAP